MYLISFNNFDYIIVTIFFCVMMIVAYSFRHKNVSSQAFLSNLIPLNYINNFSVDIGIIEFIIAGMAGSMMGIGAIYYAWAAILIQMALQYKINYELNRYSVNNFSSYVRVKFGLNWGIVVSLWQTLILLSLNAIAIILIFEIFKSLLGWNFINSVLGIILLTIITILIGGTQAINYNRIIQHAVIFFISIFVVIIALLKLGSVHEIINNLAELALKNGLMSNHYLGITLKLNYSGWRFYSPPCIFLLLVAGLTGMLLIKFDVKVKTHDSNTQLLKNKKNAKNKNSNKGSDSKIKIIIGICKLLLITLLIFIGILAIATPVTSNYLTDGRRIVTVEAQLPDGETAYIVKAIGDVDILKENDVKTAGGLQGIVPPIINDQTNLVEANQYDYKLASIVSLKHYLPKNYTVLIFILLVATFMLSLSEYLITSVKLIIENIVTPCLLLSQYGDKGKLWISRVLVIVIAIISLLMAYIFLPYFNLLDFISWIIVALIFPLLLFCFFVLIWKK